MSNDPSIRDEYTDEADLMVDHDTQAIGDTQEYVPAAQMSDDERAQWASDIDATFPLQGTFCGHCGLELANVTDDCWC